MALPAPLQTLYDRLKSFYNGNAYNVTSNPGGFARGGNQQGQFIAAMRDYADFGQGIADIGFAVQADADRFSSAVDAIEAGPVSSVNGRSGAVTGLVENAQFAALETELRGDVTEAIDALPDKATGTILRGLTDDATFVTPKANADAMAFVTAAATATIAPNFAQGFNRIYTMGLNAMLGQPTGMKDGLPVVLYLVQDATGARTLTFSATYNKFAGGTIPTLSTAANAVDRLSGICRNRSGTLVVEWSGLEKDLR